MPKQSRDVQAHPFRDCFALLAMTMYWLSINIHKNAVLPVQRDSCAGYCALCKLLETTGETLCPKLPS